MKLIIVMLFISLLALSIAAPASDILGNSEDDVEEMFAEISTATTMFGESPTTMPSTST